MFGFNNKKQEREIQNQIASNQQLYHRVFGTEDGKAVLKDLLKRCYVNYTTVDNDPYKTYFNEGRRSIYAYINNLLNRELKEILEELTGKE